MNDFAMTLLVRLRRDEMIRKAEQARLAARGGQAPGGTLTRLAMAAARMRPTVTGR
jgi:hypothetical protein